MTAAEDRALRKKRRAIKRQEKERNRAERDLRRQRRERIRTGGPILVKADPEPGACYYALRNYHPIWFCETCRTIKREDWMFSETECLGCHDTKEPMAARAIAREAGTAPARVTEQIELF